MKDKNLKIISIRTDEEVEEKAEQLAESIILEGFDPEAMIDKTVYDKIAEWKSEVKAIAGENLRVIVDIHDRDKFALKILEILSDKLGGVVNTADRLVRRNKKNAKLEKGY